MRPISNVNTVEASAKPFMSTPPSSPWHSPLPYLFGCLSAMLGLIAFALLLLACSYCRLSGRLDNNNGGGDADDVQSGENEGDSNKQVKVYEEKVLVIMAGELNPTFLATPVFTKPPILVDQNGDEEGAASGEKMKEEMDDHHQQLPTISDNHERFRQQQTQDQLADFHSF